MDAKVYKILNTPIDQLIVNPTNPRQISDEKFQRLVRSIKDAPWMLQLRPIVANKDGVILGGNQRYKACLEAGLTHVWCIWADEISDEETKRFILRDNIDFGKWDLEIMRRQYSQVELQAYGLEIQLLEMESPKVTDEVKQPPPMGDDDAVEPDLDEDELEESQKNFNDNSIKQIVFQLPDEIYQEALKSMDEISKKLDLDDNSEVLMHLINYYEVSHGLTDTDNDSLKGQIREDEDGQTSM